MRHFPENRRKLQELIVFISQQCASHDNYGSTVLNKILFFADFLAYAKLGQPITGAEYVRERHGPVPRPVRRGPEGPIRQLVRDGAIKIKETTLDRNMKRVTPVALRAPDLSVFSSDELALAKTVIDSFEGWTAGAISKWTHQLPQWHAVPLNETIPYELVFVANDQRFNEAETRHGLELAKRYGWPLSKRER